MEERHWFKEYPQFSPSHRTTSLFDNMLKTWVLGVHSCCASDDIESEQV